MIQLLVLFAIAASAMPPVARAAEADRSRESLRPFCSADYARLCDGLDPNGPEVIACFRTNAREVSPACRAAIADYAAAAPDQPASQ